MRRLAVVLSAASLAACAKIEVVKVKSGVSGEGMFYALPTTVVRVQPKVDMKKLTAAPFSRFAPIFVPEGEVVCDASCTVPAGEQLATATKYSVQPAAVFTTYGEPDPENVYLVKFSGNRAVDQTIAMTWNEAGLLSTASASVTNRTGDIALAGLKLGASLGTKAFFGSSVVPADDKKKTPTSCRKASKNDPWVLKQLADEDLKDEPFLDNWCRLTVAFRDTTYDEQRDAPVLEDALAAYKSQVRPYAKARLTALTQGQVIDPIPVSTKLDSIITARLSNLFLGSVATKTWEGSFDIRSVSPANSVRLFSTSSSGLCLNEALLAPDAKPYPKGFTVKKVDDATCKEAAVNYDVSFSLHPAAANQLFTTAKPAINVSDDSRGFRYRIPAQVRAALKSTEGTTIKENTAAVFSVAQLGTIAMLPAKQNSKMLSYELGIVEATGGLKSFKLGTTGSLDAATIDALSGVGGTVLDARNAATKEAKTNADELTILTRQQALLKLKDEICELQKKYGQQCTP